MTTPTVTLNNVTGATAAAAKVTGHHTPTLVTMHSLELKNNVTGLIMLPAPFAIIYTNTTGGRDFEYTFTGLTANESYTVTTKVVLDKESAEDHKDFTPT